MNEIEKSKGIGKNKTPNRRHGDDRRHRPYEYTGIEKIETGIEGFDMISEGGLPKGRTTLIAGTSGSAKTIFAVQFLS